jgi:putative membrane protein
MVVGGAAMLVSVGAAHAGVAAERSYVQSAQAINQVELGLGQLAQQRGSSDAVKQMSHTMVERHSALSAQLAELARARGIAPPEKPSAEDEEVHGRLAKLSGRSFDEAFVRAVTDVHTRELALHRGEVEHSGDAGLRGYAQSRVSALEASMAQVKAEW